MLLPTAAAWLYFVRLAGHESALLAYLLGKTLQFALPLLVLVDWRPTPPRSLVVQLRSLRSEFIRWTAVSTVGAGFVVAVYSFGLDGSRLAEGIAARITPKLVDFSVSSFSSYLILALLLSFVHSFLEEYYFRWFLFGALRQRTGLSVAYCLSSLAFMAHHVIVIATYLGPGRWGLLLLLSVGVASTGGFWAWLYQRTGSLLVPWLSHVIADLAIMLIGWDLAGSG